jgi:hypothetical protein
MNLKHSRVAPQTRRISPGAGLNVDTACPTPAPNDLLGLEHPRKHSNPHQTSGAEQE